MTVGYRKLNKAEFTLATKSGKLVGGTDRFVAQDRRSPSLPLG
jgi:hypothetical protein